MDESTADAVRVSTWSVRIHGTDDLLPALDRADAFRRAHEVNARFLVSEADPTAPRSELAPAVWAVPVLRLPMATTVDAVEEAWKEWGRG
ncbi:hypothetical protein IU451_29000 [Nocardia cyriacigeorgica]|uniref:hypothetical protein n=1 Tax=Nocardia cyriacigeorgica TaxID=135487 RepID=UPI0018959C47|nr:hypothetical protein [Nocardia cyriacigeorgica]MBF6326542.1 hypothetical protein [Nocardia cyriacigeorgica]